MAGSNAGFISVVEPGWPSHSRESDEFPRINDLGGEIYRASLAISSYAHPI